MTCAISVCVWLWWLKEDSALVFSHPQTCSFTINCFVILYAFSCLKKLIFVKYRSHFFSKFFIPLVIHRIFFVRWIAFVEFLFHDFGFSEKQICKYFSVSGANRKLDSFGFKLTQKRVCVFLKTSSVIARKDALKGYSWPAAGQPNPFLRSVL